MDYDSMKSILPVFISKREAKELGNVERYKRDMYIAIADETGSYIKTDNISEYYHIRDIAMKNLYAINYEIDELFNCYCFVADTLYKSSLLLRDDVRNELAVRFRKGYYFIIYKSGRIKFRGKSRYKKSFMRYIMKKDKEDLLYPKVFKHKVI